jgi:hypothetical protein
LLKASFSLTSFPAIQLLMCPIIDLWVAACLLPYTGEASNPKGNFAMISRESGKLAKSLQKGSVRLPSFSYKTPVFAVDRGGMNYYTPDTMAFEDERRFDQPPAERQPKNFEEIYRRGLLGERTRTNEDGSTTTYVAYRLFLQRGEPADEQGVADFCLNALQAGYKEAMGTLIVPDTYSAPDSIVEKRGNDELLSSVFFFLEKPVSQSEVIDHARNEQEWP